MDDLPGLGLPDALRNLAWELRHALPSLLKQAAHHASSCPESPMDETVLDEVNRLALVAGMHLEGAATRQEGHLKAQQRLRDEMETRVLNAVAGLEAAGLGEAFDPRGFFVYCLWGAEDDRPLYVGQSSNILARLGSHLGDPAKRRLVRSVTLVRCSTYRRMMTLEGRLIRKYNPQFNTAGCDRTLIST